MFCYRVIILLFVSSIFLDRKSPKYQIISCFRLRNCEPFTGIHIKLASEPGSFIRISCRVFIVLEILCLCHVSCCFGVTKSVRKLVVGFGREKNKLGLVRVFAKKVPSQLGFPRRNITVPQLVTETQ